MRSATLSIQENFLHYVCVWFHHRLLEHTHTHCLTVSISLALNDLVIETN